MRAPALFAVGAPSLAFNLRMYAPIKLCIALSAARRKILAARLGDFRRLRGSGLPPLILVGGQTQSDEVKCLSVRQRSICSPISARRFCVARTPNPGTFVRSTPYISSRRSRSFCAAMDAAERLRDFAAGLLSCGQQLLGFDLHSNFSSRRPVARSYYRILSL